MNPLPAVSCCLSAAITTDALDPKPMGLLYHDSSLNDLASCCGGSSQLSEDQWYPGSKPSCTHLGSFNVFAQSDLINPRHT